VVNEVMNAGKPVIVSDAVGAGLDLVKSGVNGNVFTAGNAADLRDKLLPWLRDAALRSRGGQESLRIINHWSFEEDVAGLKAVMPLLKKNQVHA
jgi:glycosyltransferase involved in cell wall biosynthesis